MVTDTMQIKQETRILARFVGTIWAKWITFLLLIPANFALAPISVYLMALTALLPLTLQAVFGDKTAKTDSPIFLTQIKQKYHFSYQKYRAEKNANPLLLVFLCIWQYMLVPSGLPAFWRIYPGLLIMINIMTRLITTIIFRLTLHYRFLHLKMLEE